MRAHDLGNYMLSQKDNPIVILWEWTQKGSRHYYVSTTSSGPKKGFIFLSAELSADSEINEAEKKETYDLDFIDYKKVINTILENKTLLPTLIGIDPGFDKLITEKLKGTK